MADAALGSSVEIPTISGKAKVKVEEGTQSGKILRLRGKDCRGRWIRTGDLLVHINVWTPQNLSKEEKSFFEKCRESKFQPNPTQEENPFLTA